MNEENQWLRYGLTDLAWNDLSPIERVEHYNRQLPIRGCNHKANFFEWPEELRDCYSRDPYFHIAHMEICSHKTDCYCQMCANRIGHPRPKRVVSDRVKAHLSDLNARRRAERAKV
jgi:hypothetical protein